MCDLLNLVPIGTYREEHHVFNGPNRHISEKYGLKVYLCLKHHTAGAEAVHNNSKNMLLLKKEGQKAFMKAYPNEDFKEIFGKNYLTESDIEEMKEKERMINAPAGTGFHILPEYREYLMKRFLKKE